MTQQRKFARIDFETEVTIDLDGAKQTGTTVNVSQGGALIKINSSLLFGQKLVVEIQLPKIKDVCRIPSVVRWRNDESIGVQFETLRAIEVWGINQLLHQNK